MRHGHTSLISVSWNRDGANLLLQVLKDRYSNQGPNTAVDSQKNNYSIMEGYIYIYINNIKYIKILCAINKALGPAISSWQNASKRNYYKYKS